MTGRFLDELYSLDLESGYWELLGSSKECESDVWPKGRHFHSCVTLGPSFYLFFGKSNGYMNDVFQYRVEEGKWKKMETNEGPSRRYGHTAVEWSGEIYIYGGFDDFGLRCNDLWKYDPKRNEWSLIQNLQSEAPDALHHSAVVHQGSMLVWSGVDALNDLYEFRFGSRSWSKVVIRKGQTPRPKWGHKCFVCEDSMYVVGGTDALVCDSTVWQFSLDSCEWSLIGVGSFGPRYFHSIVTHGSKLFVFGGKNTHNYAFNDVFVWNFRKYDVIRPVSSFQQDFMRLMSQADEEDQPSVVAIMFRDGKIRFHSNILFCRASKLRKSCSKDGIIKLDISKSIGLVFRFYIYTSQIPPDSDLLPSQWLELIKLANDLDMYKFQARCEFALSALIDMTNVVSVFSKCIALKKKCNIFTYELCSHCVRFIIPVFSELRQSLRDELPEVYYSELKQLWRDQKEKQEQEKSIVVK